VVFPTRVLFFNFDSKVPLEPALSSFFFTPTKYTRACPELHSRHYHFRAILMDRPP
jgi:hypothetical protein